MPIPYCLSPIHPTVYPHIRLSIQPWIHPLTDSSINIFIHPSVPCSSIHAQPILSGCVNQVGQISTEAKVIQQSNEKYRAHLKHLFQWNTLLKCKMLKTKQNKLSQPPIRTITTANICVWAKDVLSSVLMTSLFLRYFAASSSWLHVSRVNKLIFIVFYMTISRMDISVFSGILNPSRFINDQMQRSKTNGIKSEKLIKTILRFPLGRLIDTTV